MLSIHPTRPQKCTPHLLSARINHNGPINSTAHFFAPTTDAQGTQHVYFRGRHLHGTAVPLPENYTGAVLHVTDKQAPQAPTQHNVDRTEDDDEDEVGELAVEVSVAEQVGAFEEFVVWGHGEKVDGGQDAFVRGVGEWVVWAESMHVDEEEDGEETVEGKKA